MSWFPDRAAHRGSGRLHRWWTTAWLLWASSGLIMELLALQSQASAGDGRGRVLSRQVWALWGRWPAPLRVGIAGVGFGWLIFHFALGWW